MSSERASVLEVGRHTTTVHRPICNQSQRKIERVKKCAKKCTDHKEKQKDDKTKQVKIVRDNRRDDQIEDAHDSMIMVCKEVNVGCRVINSGGTKYPKKHYHCKSCITYSAFDKRRIKDHLINGLCIPRVTESVTPGSVPEKSLACAEVDYRKEIYMVRGAAQGPGKPVACLFVPYLLLK